MWIFVIKGGEWGGFVAAIWFLSLAPYIGFLVFTAIIIDVIRFIRFGKKEKSVKISKQSKIVLAIVLIFLASLLFYMKYLARTDYIATLLAVFRY
jgi:Na+-transporting methylmalonyl-CoA/oxaloacetate decarboxylase beta subunit